MSELKVSGKAFCDSVCTINYRVNDERDIGEFSRLKHIFMYGVAVRDTAGYRVNGSASGRTGLKVIFMVCVDRISAGDSGKNHLSSAAEACKEVEYDSAYKDPVVALHSELIYLDLVSSGCCSNGYEIIAVAVVVLMSESCAEVFADKVLKVFLLLESVCADAGNEEDILILYADLLKFLHKDMYDYGRSCPKSCYIGYNDTYGLSGFNYFLKFGASDGIFDSLSYYLFLCLC